MDSCSIVEDNTLLSQIVSEVASGLQPRVENTHLYSFKEASKYEMTCYNDIATAVTELDEEICNINPKHLRYMRNKGCWNGTHSKGRQVCIQHMAHIHTQYTYTMYYGVESCVRYCVGSGCMYCHSVYIEWLG